MHTDLNQFERTAYFIITWLFRFFGKIPAPVARRLGNMLGMVGYGADKKHRNITLNNLNRAFGKEKTEDQLSVLSKNVFRNIGQILFEIGWLSSTRLKGLQNKITVKGLEHYTNAYKKGKGVLIITGHIGNWELLSIAGTLADIPINVLYRPLDFKPMDRFMEKMRTRFGAKLITANHGMRKTLMALKKGEAVVILLDQNVDYYLGVWVDFFGTPACTSNGLALLAQKTGAPVISAFLTRANDGFVVEFGKEIPLVKTGDKTKDVYQNTFNYTKSIEDHIRKYPEQWFWVHRRWKTKHYCDWPKKIKDG